MKLDFWGRKSKECTNITKRKYKINTCNNTKETKRNLRIGLTKHKTHKSKRKAFNK